MICKLSASALVIAAFLTTPATAEKPAPADSEPPPLVNVRATVDFSDLDLRSPAGVAEFERRAEQAVGDMCRPRAVPAGLGRGRLDGHCYRRSMTTARRQIRALVAARNGEVQTALNRPANRAVSE